MKVIFLFTLFFAALMLPHIASAVNDTLSTDNCDSLGFVPSLCGTLREYSQRAGWSVDQEKRYLLNIFAEGGTMPNHDFVKDWNSRLVFGDTAPDNKTAASKPCSDFASQNCISDAWIRTFSLMPSFIENDTFYIESSGDVQAGYHYGLSAPPTQGRDYACSRSEPGNNRYGDCKTVFSYEDLSKYEIKMDGSALFEGDALEYGENKIVGFSTGLESPSFKSTLSIRNRIWREHYEWDKGGVCKTVCTTSKKGTKCKTYYHYYCEYDNTDHVDETMTLSHSFEGEISQFHKPSISHDIVIGNVKTTPRGVMTTNARDFKLFMNSALLHKAGSKYPMTYFYSPYNTLALVREISSSYFVDDLYIQNTGNSTISFTTYPYNMDDCSFVALWPFDYDTESCSMLKKATTELKIDTEERRHKMDEDVKIMIDFDSDNSNNDALINLTYGETQRTIMLDNGAETVILTPIEGYNTVSVEFAGDAERSSAKAIPLGIYASDDTFATYIGIALVFFVVYGMGYFARRYMPG